MSSTFQSHVNDDNLADDPLAGDPELRRELAAMFLEDSPQLMLEIRAAVTGRDGSSLRFAAHTLKGSVGVFNVQRAFDGAFRMENVGKECDWEHSEAAWELLVEEMANLTAALANLTVAVPS